MIGTDGTGRKHTIGEISFDMAEYVGYKKQKVSFDSKSKPNKKIGEGMKLCFDLTILKPAEYIKEAAKEESEKRERIRKATLNARERAADV